MQSRNTGLINYNTCRNWDSASYGKAKTVFIQQLYTLIKKVQQCELKCHCDFEFYSALLVLLVANEWVFVVVFVWFSTISNILFFLYSVDVILNSIVFLNPLISTQAAMLCSLISKKTTIVNKLKCKVFCSTWSPVNAYLIFCQKPFNVLLTHLHLDLNQQFEIREWVSLICFPSSIWHRNFVLNQDNENIK